jgi:hypothetical protein
MQAEHENTSADLAGGKARPRGARLDREATQRLREREAAADYLAALRELLRNLENLHQASRGALGRDTFETYRTSVKATLAVYGLQKRLAKTFTLAQWPYGSDFGTCDEEALDGRAEVAGLIEEVVLRT